MEHALPALSIVPLFFSALQCSPKSLGAGDLTWHAAVTEIRAALQNFPPITVESLRGVWDNSAGNHLPAHVQEAIMSRTSNLLQTQLYEFAMAAAQAQLGEQMPPMNHAANMTVLAYVLSLVFVFAETPGKGQHGYPVMTWLLSCCGCRRLRSICEQDTVEAMARAAARGDLWRACVLQQASGQWFKADGTKKVALHPQATGSTLTVCIGHGVVLES